MAREVGLQIAEAMGGDVICPVLLNRAPDRCQKALGEDALIVVDGCGTRCASKLAAGVGAKPKQKFLVSMLVKASAERLQASLRLGSGEMALAESIVADIVAALGAPGREAAPAAWRCADGLLRRPLRQVRVPHPQTGLLVQRERHLGPTDGDPGKSRHLRLPAAAAHRHPVLRPAGARHAGRAVRGVGRGRIVKGDLRGHRAGRAAP